MLLVQDIQETSLRQEYFVSIHYMLLVQGIRREEINQLQDVSIHYMLLVQKECDLIIIPTL